jgi:ABC-type glycerol-3-phosphate transport system permease component
MCSLIAREAASPSPAISALTTLLAIAPILVVFLFSQRALVSGMLAGATKE